MNGALKSKDFNSYIEEQSPFAFAFKKTEKLTIALHMVTSFMDKHEPLYLEMREKGLAVLSYILFLRTNRDSSESVLFEKIYNLLIDVIALLDVAYYTGYISEMNWSILKREYTELGNFIKEKEKYIVPQKASFSRSFFDIPEVAEKSRFGKRIKDINRRASLDKGQIISSREDFAKKTRRLGTKREERHKERRRRILAAVEERGNMSIKDISAIVADCSEKTLQRELVSLLKQGVLKKSGERRWSTYSLA